MDWTPEEVFAEIDRQAAGFGVNPTYAKAIAIAENTSDGKFKNSTAWRRDATSPAGARGILQVMPGTAKGLQQAGLLPPEWKYEPDNLSSQVSAGLAAMKDVSSRSRDPNDPYELAAGYNGSPAVHKNFQDGKFDKLPTETRNYFTKVRTALMDLGTNPSNVGAPVTPASGTGKGSAGTGTSRSTTSSQRVGDPEVMSQLLMDGFSLVKPGGGYDQLNDQVVGSAEVRNEAYGNLFGNILMHGKAVGEAAGAAAAVDAAEATRRALILGTSNLNPTVTGNLMDRTVQVINETDEQLRPMKAEIDSRMAVGFFDNPLEWMVNQTRLPGMVAAYNGLAGKQNAAIETFKQTATLAGTTQQLSKGIDADEILRSGTAKAAEAATAANMKLSEAQVAAETANSRDYLTLAHIAGEKLGTELKLFSATAVTKSEKAGESAKESAAKQELESLDNVNRLITAAGGNGISLAQFKMMGTKDKEEIVQLASTGKFGKDFSQSFTFQDTVGNRRELARKGGLSSVIWMDSTQQKAMELAKADIAKWEKTNIGKLVTTKQREEVVASSLNQVQALYESEYRNNLRGATNGNPYKLDYVAWSKSPELVNNPLAIFINQYGPEGKEPVFKEVDEKYILDRFTASVMNGSMQVADASKAVSDFYKFAIQKQALITAYPLYGLNPATQYNVDIPQNTIFGGPSIAAGKVDMADPKKVENYLTRNVALRVTSNNIAKQAVPPVMDPFNLLAR